MKTKTIRFNQAVSLLQAGKIVAIPTETVYGLAGLALNKKAIEQIFRIKKRPLSNPLIIHCFNRKQMSLLHTVQSSLLNKMIQHFCPGPLTFILKKSKQVSSIITSNKKKVALRIPQHPLTLSLLKKVGPLCAPSANYYGQLSPTRPEHVRQVFKNQVPILDGGRCAIGIESTVLEPDFKNHRLIILRAGMITKKHLIQWLSKENLKNWKIIKSQSSVSPGQSNTHYQPTVPFFLVKVNQKTKPTEQQIKKFLLLKIKKLYPKLIKQKPIFKELKLGTLPDAVAQKLYNNLAQLSKNPRHIIYACKTPTKTTDNWQAIWDRLKKGSLCHFTWTIE